MGSIPKATEGEQLAAGWPTWLSAVAGAQDGGRFLMGENYETGLMGRIKEDGSESRSGSDNMEGASGDDQDTTSGKKSRKKKKYHRHTPYQIQELESSFKDNPYPDEKQSLDLGKRLGLESKQVKFWFQN